MHNEVDCIVWEAKINETGSKKLPDDIIKCFLKVEFERNISFFPFGFPHEVDDFLQNNRVFRSAPTLQKTALVGTNNIIKDRPKAVDKDFGDNFVSDIAKAYGTEIFVGLRSVYFRYKSNESIRYAWVKETCLKS
jgi:hypothetical protein